MTLTHTVVDRTLCPSLSGNVHFDLSMANRNALRGLIEDDEICRTYVNVYGLVATAFDKRSGSFAVRITHPFTLHGTHRSCLRRLAPVRTLHLPVWRTHVHAVTMVG